MTTSDLVGELEDAYRRFLGGEPEALLSLLSAEVVYHLPGLHLGGGTLRGRGALVARLARAAEALGEAPRVRLLGASGESNFVVTFEQLSAKLPSATLDQQVCAVWRFSKGKCEEVWAFFEDQAACDAFWRAVPEMRSGMS